MNPAGLSVPPIYVPRDESPAAPRSARLLAAGLALGCLALLVTATRLTPDPRGYGSHTGLGLQECQLIRRANLPCPGCGMTTSFAWFVRGNVVASVYVQPMGAALALLAACGVWGGAYVAATGRPAYRVLRVLPDRYYLVPLFALAVLAWGWKILIHANGRDGW